MKKLLPILYLFSLSAFAQWEIVDIIQSLEQLSSGVYNSSPESCQDCLDDHDLLNRCAKSLCGNPKDINSAYLYNKNYDQYVQAESLREFGRLKSDLKKYLREVIKKEQEYLTNLKNSITDGSIDTLIQNIQPPLLDRLVDKIYPAYFELEIDHALPPEERLVIHYNSNFDSLPSDAQSAIRSYAEAKQNTIKTDKSTAIQNGVYTLNEARKILSQKVEILNTDFKSTDAPNAAEKIRKLNLFDIENSNDLTVIASKIYIADSIITPRDESRHRSLYCQAKVCQDGLAIFLRPKKLLTLVEQAIETTNQRSLLNQMVNNCQSVFIYNAIIENNDNIHDLEQQWPNILDLFKSRFMNRFSLETRQKFATYVEEHLSFDSSYKPAPIANMNFENLATQTETLKNATMTSTPFDLIDRLREFYSQEEATFKYTPSFLCSDDVQALTRDRFRRSPNLENQHDIIQASLYSSTHPMEGQAIISHELAHALSANFARGNRSRTSYGDYLKLRSCASDFYFADDVRNSRDRRHPKDKLYTEEDTADIISAIVNPDSDKLFSCSLLRPTSSAFNFQNLSLASETISDPHAPPFIRLLREAINKRAILPATCQRIIDNNADRFGFKPCP